METSNLKEVEGMEEIEDAGEEARDGEQKIALVKKFMCTARIIRWAWIRSPLLRQRMATS